VNSSPFIVFIVMLSGIAFPANSGAQTPSQPLTRDSQALTLLAQCSQSMGLVGPDAAFEATGQITSLLHTDGPFQITVELEGQTEMRRSVSFSEGQQIYIVNNGSVHATSGSANIPIAPWQENYFRPDYIPALACSIDIARPQMNVIYHGIETLGSSQAYHIEFFAPAQSLPGGSVTLDPIISEFHVWLDSQSLTVVRTKRFMFSPDAIENHSDWDTYYTDYHPVAGVLMPFRVQHFLAGKLLEDITFANFQMTSGFATQDFQW